MSNSVSNIVTTVAGGILDTTANRYSALLNNFFGATSKKIGVNNVFEIFSKVESLTSEKKQNYNEQKAIGQKATIVAGGLELTKYSLPIKLHASYCNPDDIITALEVKVQTREVFSFYLFNNYMGEFVVSGVQSDRKDCLNGKTIYAEIVVNLIEYYDNETDTTYKQQTKGTAQTSSATATLTKKTAVDVVLDETSNIYARLTAEVIMQATRASESYINSTIGGLYGSI